MAEIRPFKGLRFTSKAGNIKELVCPPYDIINEEEREALLAKNPYNTINLELSKEGADIYAGAAANLKTFLAEGILKEDDQPSLYIYEEEFEAYGAPHKIKGLISLIRLEDFKNRVVLPHEDTLAKAKEDRLNLMKATACNFSSIYLLYQDAENRLFSEIDRLSDRSPDQTFTTGDGIIHRLWFVSDKDEIGNLQTMFSGKQLYIADGHHRYTTMLNYRDYLRETGVNTSDEHLANFGMMTMINLENPGLVVFPTHRVIKDLPNFSVSQLLEGAKAYFEITETDPRTLEATVTAEEHSSDPVFGFYADGKGWTLRLTDHLIMDQLLAERSSAYRGLDVAILHTLLLERLLGIDKESLANQKNLIYTRSANEGMELVDKGEGNCVFLLSSTRVDEISAVADADDRMPQKSTYFYPKLITGHVMYKIMDI